MGVVDNKNIITEPEKSPVTPSSSLKLGKGLNKTSSMPENEVLHLILLVVQMLI